MISRRRVISTFISFRFHRKKKRDELEWSWRVLGSQSTHLLFKVASHIAESSPTSGFSKLNFSVKNVLHNSVGAIIRGPCMNNNKKNEKFTGAWCVSHWSRWLSDIIHDTSAFYFDISTQFQRDSFFIYGLVWLCVYRASLAQPIPGRVGRRSSDCSFTSSDKKNGLRNFAQA